MRRPAAALLLLLVLLPAAAPAQVDPDPVGIGMYFDTAATVNVLAVPGAGGEPAPVATAWLVVTRLPQGTSVGYWNGTVAPYAPGAWSDTGAFIFGFTVVGQNLAMNMPGDPRWSFLVFEDPGVLPGGDAVVLARLEITCASAQPIPLYVQWAEIGVYGYPSSVPQPSSGAWDRPVAMINGPAPVAVTGVTWGGVKSLFR